MTRSASIICLIVSLVLLALVPACAKADTSSSPSSSSSYKVEEIRLVGTIGPLSIPLAYMKENNSLSSIASSTTLTIWSNPSQLQAIITGGQGDFISLPTNSAAIFYNKGVSLQLLDSSIWNILYLVTGDSSIQSITDLKGKRVVVPYQGAIPDAMFRYVCQQEGLNPDQDLEIYYAPDPIQAAQLMLAGKEKYILLSEPSATSVILQGQKSGNTFIRALNMQTEWQKASGGQHSTPVAGTIVLGSLKDHPDAVKVFMAEYHKAVQWMLDNPAEAGNTGARALAEQGFTAGVLTESLKNINWRFADSRSARTDIEAFFNALSQVSLNFIGGELPDDGFYFGQ